MFKPHGALYNMALLVKRANARPSCEEILRRPGTGRSVLPDRALQRPHLARTGHAGQIIGRGVRRRSVDLHSERSLVPALPGCDAFVTDRKPNGSTGSRYFGA